MKKNLIFSACCHGLILLALLLHHNIAIAQDKAGTKARLEQKSLRPSSSNWEAISLADANAKILPVAPLPRFSLSLGGILPLGNINIQSVPFTSLQAAVLTPGTFEQLFERLQGEFFIGSLSSQADQNFEMSGTTLVMPGLRFGLRLGESFELRAGGYYFQNKWSGDFPVLVFTEQQHPSQPPKTLQCTLSASSSGVLADVDLAYFITRGIIRPFVQAGVRGQFPIQHESGAMIAGVALPLETTPFGTVYSPMVGAGLSVSFLKSGFVEANATLGKLPGGDIVPSIGCSMGWHFGTFIKD